MKENKGVVKPKLYSNLLIKSNRMTRRRRRKRRNGGRMKDKKRNLSHCPNQQLFYLNPGGFRPKFYSIFSLKVTESQGGGGGGGKYGG